MPEPKPQPQACARDGRSGGAVAGAAGLLAGLGDWSPRIAGTLAQPVFALAVRALARRAIAPRRLARDGLALARDLWALGVAAPSRVVAWPLSSLLRQRLADGGAGPERGGRPACCWRCGGCGRCGTGWSATAGRCANTGGRWASSKSAPGAAWASPGWPRWRVAGAGRCCWPGRACSTSAARAGASAGAARWSPRRPLHWAAAARSRPPASRCPRHERRRRATDVDAPTTSLAVRRATWSRRCTPPPAAAGSSARWS